MANNTWTVTGPDGTEYDVTGPSSQEEAISYVQKKFPQASTGQNVVKSVMNPAQSIPDLLRTTSDFVTLGLNDRLRAWLKGTNYADEKKQTEYADTRLGSINEAADLGAAMLQPSAAAGYVPEAGAAGRLGQFGKSALGWSAEGAGQAGAQAVIKGEDPVSAMEKGAVAGAGGKLLSTAGRLQWPGMDPIKKTLDVTGGILQGGKNPMVQAGVGLATHGYGPAAGNALSTIGAALPAGAGRSLVAPSTEEAKNYLARMMMNAGRL
jgi:hypothetical protein